MAEKRNQTKATRREFLEGAGATAAVMLAGQRKAAFAQGRPQTGAADWPRFGCDPRNTRFNARETTLGRVNVGRL